MVIAMPSTNIKWQRFGVEYNSRVFLSKASRSVQTVELPGARWNATYTIAPLVRADAEAWQTFLLQLKGMAGGRFYALVPEIGLVAAGSLGGTPMVDGAGQTGNTLNVKGWSNSIVNVLKQGDYFHYATPTGWQQLHKVRTTAHSGSTGETALAIDPPIRESPADEAAITTLNCSVPMMLAGDGEAFWELSRSSSFDEITFSGVEVWEQGA